MVTVNVLLAVLVSVPLNDAWPVELNEPVSGTLKFIVTIMVCPAEIVSALQVIVPPLPTGSAVHKPVEVESELKGSPAGNDAVKTTELAGAFCAFLICQVIVSVVVGPLVGPPFRGDPVT
jgi:hypothetical protein